jgi:riboflavin synthase
LIVFTGLVEEKGRVIHVEQGAHGRRLEIGCSLILSDVAVDHSIAVNGVCLTVVAHTDASFTVDVIEETLRKTSIGMLHEGSSVNLERAMQLGARLGGHIVLGHVDTTGVVEEISAVDLDWNIWISFPAEFRRYLIPVGSICVDGVSLTVAELEPTRFKISIIPHTLAVTTIGTLKIGDRVNLEFDVLAKYAESASLYSSSKPAGM